MKAILLIDIDEKIHNSNVSSIHFENGEVILFTKDVKLKSMPEEREDESCHEYDCCLMTSIGGIGDARCYRCGEANGWNDCIDYLTGDFKE